MPLVVPNQPIIFSPPNGTSRLPLVEIDRTKVTTKYKPVRIRAGTNKRAAADCSYGDFNSTELDFSAWEFFHAAKKTELACSFTTQAADRRAFAFALEHENTFVWDTANFRKKNSSVFTLEDFAETGLAGRIGEAIAYLSMVDRGYVFWDRCASVWARAARNAHISHADQLRVVQYLSSNTSSGRPAKEPDFIFENQNGDIALMEAKGAFVEHGTDYPYTKSVLKQALKQLNAWSSVITPTPGKSFGIATLLREESDTHTDPSLIAYVDPPGNTDQKLPKAKLPSDLVRRCNYGNWLVGMGLVSSGSALRGYGEKIVDEIELPVLSLGRRKFAFVTLGWEAADSFYAPWLWPMLFLLGPKKKGTVMIMGIDSMILHFISRAVHKPHEPILTELSMGRDDEHKMTIDQFPGSIFPDGTMLGNIRYDELHKCMKAMEKFIL